MGRSITYTYEVQVEHPETKALALLGAMSFGEAQDKLLTEAHRLNSRRGYIWPQTAIGRNRIARKYGQSVNYLMVNIEANTPTLRKWFIHAVCLDEHGQQSKSLPCWTYRNGRHRE